MANKNLTKKPPTQPRIPKCTLHQFFAVWADLQTPAWDIPAFHIEVLDFLSNHDKWENGTGLLEIFRGAAKSTITGLFITWMLTQNPALRFLILSCDMRTARKMTIDIASIIDRHPLAKHLRGNEGQWRADTLEVVGATDGRNPSVTCAGVLSNITGGRADWVIYDDVEVPKNSRTELERDKLRLKLDEPTHILVPGGRELFIGTPHTFDSIYPELEGVSGKDAPLRTGCSVLKIPVMENVEGEFPNLTGTPTWPERFPLEVIKKKQDNSNTKGHFLSQYLLLPYNPEETVLDPTLIATYNNEINVHRANGDLVARIGESRVMGYSAVWDPSLADTKSDDSVLAIVFTTDDGHYFVHRAVKLLGDPEEQIHQIVRHMRECDVSHLVIEKNGPGGFLPSIFRSVTGGMGLSCEGKHTSQNKAQKIMEAYEARLTGGYIHAHTSVMNSPFRTQLRDFSYKQSGREKDDFIDAVAMAILNQPIRLKSTGYGVRASQWQAAAGGGGFEVAVDPVQF